MDEIVRFFNENGCGVVKGFASTEECQQMKAEVLRLVKENASTMIEKKTSFRTDEKQVETQGNDDYFLNSADKIHFFWEPSADPREDQTPEELLLQVNKIGHGMHVQNEVFKNYAESSKVADLVRALGWKKPVLPQSMYILKQPKIGGEVTAHQDSTFLFTEPRQTCLGLWLALDDADLENGCLWYRPGSHVEPVRRHFCRAADGHMDFEQLVSDQEMSELEGRSLHSSSKEEDLKLREELCAKNFVAVPCKAGDLVLIHGQVEHLSLHNHSEKQRHSFQLHLVDGPENGITWSPKNWLQYPDGRAFPKL